MTKFYKEILDAFGKPQEYKDIKIYPIKLIESEWLDSIYEVFSYNKNQMQDREVVRASYLKFLVFYMTDPSDTSSNNMIQKIQKLLSYITKEDCWVEILQSVENPYSFNDFRVEIHIGEKVLNETDFDIIREIVLLQSNTSLEYIESYDESLESNLSFFAKNKEQPTLAERCFSLSVGTGLPMSEIENLSYYQFSKYMQRLDAKIDHELYKPLLVSGQISFKDGQDVKSWVDHIPKQKRYAELIMDADKFKSEVGSALSET